MPDFTHIDKLVDMRVLSGPLSQIRTIFTVGMWLRIVVA